ncbi:flagellar hook assembly protein FlgD [Brevibacillus migulae]|uniref:flagellar hook assembly protein FlgD n=1 Tax=Brevibacillus migulae TaxID=1644114 RepID=UPI00106EDDD3|nr:flagellar hook capping FlgD N-terminal domain-containing protein [Brevibacillus migulae]
MADAVNSTTSTVSSAYSYKNKKEFSTELDSTSFMKLMLEQLKQQDPLSPMDNNQFLQQTSMMTMVEKMTNMEKILEEANNNYLNLDKYEALVGRTATYNKTTTNDITGEKSVEVKTGAIDAVNVQDGKIYFTIGDDIIARDDVTGLNAKGSSSGDATLDSSLKYTQMIGYEITFTDANNAEKTGTVAAVSMKNGLVELVLSDDTRVKPSQVVGFESQNDAV